ncbi:uncharacterized protein Triagg1_5997 [Trichoderma aggressivum f. europaeum]|uniref:Uncharacterized protein n=1 Tax=Trichoderma aggressivum f. europaeum TaxID=173218 RepID=A0AAE1IBU5_9HYPO|nr:hypothetical protein Triagg1_5997 [Trichoderma aggressivum f. europaeum]
MPPFERPKAPFRSSQLRAWSDNVEPRMHDLLWGDYWQRFNTIQIPIFGPDVYFDDALNIAKEAKGQKEVFERKFEELNKRRQKLACEMLTAAMRAIDEEYTYLCKNARDTVSDLCQTGCFLDFLRLLIGTSHGWEPDAAEDSQSNGTTGDLSEETQASADQLQDSSDEETHDEPPWLGDDYYEAAMDRRTREELWARSFGGDMGTFAYAGCTSSSDDTDDPESDVSVSSRENKEEKATHGLGKRKRDISDDEVVTARSLRRKLMSLTPGPIIYPLNPQGEIDWEAIDDEFLFNSEEDEYDYEYDYEDEDEDEEDDDDEDDDHDDDDDDDDDDDEGDEEEEDYDGDEDEDEDEDRGNEGRNPVRISYFL